MNMGAEGSEADMATSGLHTEDDQAVCRVYDAYIKVVLKNKSRNLKRDYYRRKKRSAQWTQWQDDMQNANTQSVALTQCDQLQVLELTCKINNDALYAAMHGLEPRKGATIILEYWYGWTDAECAKYFHVATRTVCKWRHAALSQLYQQMIREGIHETRCK